MQLHRTIKPISYVKAHAAEIIRDVAETGNPLVITQNGEAKAVLMDVHEYDALQASLAMLKMLAVSTREIQEGKAQEADAAFSALAARLEAKRHDGK